MHSLQQIINYIIHIDVYLNLFVNTYGFWTYLALFMIVFCETGLVITPFLPGDSLLFAAGSIAAQPGNELNALLLFLLLMSASVLGNQINFLIGRRVGPHIFSKKDSWLLNKKHLNQAHEFYTEHGGKTIVFARFIPIIRTFAPFVAGIGKMNPLQFSLYNLFSGLLWVGSLIGLGYFLGSLPVVKEHFTVAVYAVVFLSITPAIIAFVRSKI